MIYLHVPFCRSFCTYCGFYSEAAPKCGEFETRFQEYAKAVETEIEVIRKNGVFAPGGVNTLYVGGGTPSILPLATYERIMMALENAGVNMDFEEFTFEVNPEDIVEKGLPYVEGLLNLGVNRVSMGVQSFDDGILKFMNRRHSADQAVRAYHILEDAGVENISIDLIFGLPQLTDEVWKRTLEQALEISSSGNLPKHVSAYQLSVEPDSMLEKMLEKGIWKEASQEECQKQYMMLCEALAKAGYHHYEISNFALSGYEAVHNSAYWRHEPYVGLGPGAHSYLLDRSGRHIRQWNEPDLNRYLDAAASGDFLKAQGYEVLEQEQLTMERIMLGLRTSSGIPQSYLCDSCDRSALEKALSSGCLIPSGENFRIPQEQFFVSDNIISSIV